MPDASPPSDQRPSPGERDVLGRLLTRWGRLVHRAPWPPLLVPLLLALACLPLALPVEDRLSSGGWLPAGAEAVQVDHRLDDEFGRRSTAHYVLFSDPTGQLAATDTAFRQEVARTLAPLRGDPAVTAIHTWDSAGSALQPLLISDDGRQSLAIVVVNQDVKEAAADIPRLVGLLQSDLLTVQVGGWPATTHDFRELTSADLTRAEAISLPIVLLVLVIVFGSVILAGLPVLTTAITLVPTLAAIALLSRLLETSVFTVNVVVMIGLAISIDYALIIANRYREERARLDPAAALAVTMATAGRTVIVSGAAVAIGLLGLLTFGVPAATATAIATAVVVACGVFANLVVLPATLALLGNRVTARRRLSRRSAPLRGLATAARGVLDRHPLAALATVALALLLLAAPALHMHPQAPTMAVLPQSQPARQMFDAVQQGFSASTLSPIIVIVEPRNGRPMTHQRNLDDLVEFTNTLAGLDGVDNVVSVWSFLPPGVGPGFLSGGVRVDPRLAAVVQPYLTESAAVLEINVHASAGSAEARAILSTIRQDSTRLSDGAFTVMAGGETATSVDLITHLEARAPWTFGLVLLATALVLFAQFRSVLLPVKAILLNLLSLAASFGALVWVFQEGHLTGALGFAPLGYTIVIVPVLMFCLMFGLSMDYEVIMLSRIREEWLARDDNRAAITAGLRGTAGIVTSAALVMLVVFAAFATSRVPVIQQVGLGLALAVVVDATVIRLIALPAAMQLMGRWNWWAPPWRRPLRAQAVTAAAARVRSS